MSQIDPFELRQAFGSFMSGVTVVTALDDAQQPVGFTANSFSSVSLDPALLLVCPSRSLSSFGVFESCRYFAINILAEGQESISNRFASFKGDRFAQLDWQADQNGCPLLGGVCATFSCRRTKVEPAGDHIILLGEIVEFTRSDVRGLGFASGQYFSLGLEQKAEEIPADTSQAHVGVIIEHDGHVLLTEENGALSPPQLPLSGPTRIRTAITSWLTDLGLDSRLGNTYSIFDDVERGERYTYFRAEACNANTHGIGRYFPVTQLAELDYASAADASMLTRYALEHRNRSFGLYIGDEKEGDLINYS